MRKALLIISTLFVLATSAFAQDVFTPRWNIQLKGGVAETVGEVDFTKLLNPNAGLAFGYQFTPVFGLRMEFGGWQAKGGLPTTHDVYKFNYVQDVIDASKKAIDDAAEGGGFILSTGDQCGRDTPDENIFALVEAAKEFGRYNPDGTLA